MKMRKFLSLLLIPVLAGASFHSLCPLNPESTTQLARKHCCCCKENSKAVVSHHKCGNGSCSCIVPAPELPFIEARSASVAKTYPLESPLPVRQVAVVMVPKSDFLLRYSHFLSPPVLLKHTPLRL
jgi:hypothetical protein